MSIKKVCYFVVVSLMLSACGGGGGGGDSASSSSTTTTTTSTPSSSSSVTTPTVDLSGKTRVVDASGVEGLTYECQSTKATTSQGGVFNCIAFPIAFFLGSIPLGSVSEVNDDIIYTTDLLNQARGAAHHPDVTKVSMLLQTLDSDQNPANGIQITEANSDLANQYFYADTNLSTISLEDFEATLQDIVNENKKLSLVNAKDAQDNLTTALASETN